MRKTIPFVLLMIVLYVMYGTNIGVPGITQYWDDFKLFDMQLFYSEDTVNLTMNNIGAEGIQHYLYYFIVDLCFIAILFWVQLRLQKTVAMENVRIHKVLFVFALSRSILDIVEDILLSFIIRRGLPITVVSIAATVTLFKFICLYAWIAFLVIGNMRKSKGCKI